MRLIDGDALKEKMTVSALGGHKQYWVCGVIDDTPTIEAEPVKHGRWIDGWICSECNYGSHEPNMPYCARCGTRMDGDKS